MHELYPRPYEDQYNYYAWYFMIDESFRIITLEFSPKRKKEFGEEVYAAREMSILPFTVSNKLYSFESKNIADVLLCVTTNNKCY